MALGQGQGLLSLPSNHHYYDEKLPKVYVDSCSFHHESKLKAGVGTVWVDRNVVKPNHYIQGPTMGQYMEITAVLITLQKPAKLAVAACCFISHFPTRKEKRYEKCKEQHLELFPACNQLW